LLEQLSPAERTAFVLHDVFDVPFGEVAEVVGRTPEAVRQLASRARRHVAEQRPRFEASPDEHDRAVRAFAQAVAEGDLDGLVSVLDPDVVWTSDGGGRAIALRKPLHGAERVARAWVALRRRTIASPTPIALNGRLGLIIPGADGDRSVLSFMVDGGRITRYRRRAQPGEAAPPGPAVYVSRSARRGPRVKR
jgi:RNA polymerase sigma-70 factor, ECF subfamily